MSTSANWRGLEHAILKIIKASARPVAVAFLDGEPAGVKKAHVYTIPENHFNCAVGAYTHNIALSPEREKETEQTLKMMFGLGYVKPERR